MTRDASRGCRAALVALAAALAILAAPRPAAAAREPADQFEKVRSHVQAWLSHAASERGLISPRKLQQRVLDRWATQAARYQLVSVRKPEDDSLAGHLPHAISIYWPTLVEDASLARLDRGRTVITYCYYGHASMLSYTVLGLLGYRCLSLDFGMMGWNQEALVKAPWDGVADYPVETGPARPGPAYPPPVLSSDLTDARAILRQRAQAYFASEGSPVIGAEDLKAIVDDWERKQADYQIVSVGSREDYERGHVPHALWIPWAEMAKVGSLRRLDPKKTTVVYSDNGQTGQSAATVLNLLGYPAVALKFGMMDWNRRCLAEARQWHSAAGYAVVRGSEGS